MHKVRTICMRGVDRLDRPAKSGSSNRMTSRHSPYHGPSVAVTNRAITSGEHLPKRRKTYRPASSYSPHSHYPPSPKPHNRASLSSSQTRTPDLTRTHTHPRTNTHPDPHPRAPPSRLLPRPPRLHPQHPQNAHSPLRTRIPPQPHEQHRRILQNLRPNSIHHVAHRSQAAHQSGWESRQVRVEGERECPFGGCGGRGEC